MDYYSNEFNKLQEEFHEVMHDYPLFREDIREIEENKIKEINELLDKNDEFYLKKAIEKLKDLINYVKDTSTSIKKEYDKFDKSVKIWEKMSLDNVSNKEIDEINHKIKKASELIQSHNIKDLVLSNKIIEDLIKMNK